MMEVEYDCVFGSVFGKGEKSWAVLFFQK